VTITDGASVGAGSVGKGGLEIDAGGSGIGDVKSGGDEVGDWLTSGGCDGTRPGGSDVDTVRSEVGVADCTIVDEGKIGSSAQR
jgi:hypothetical protein